MRPRDSIIFKLLILIVLAGVITAAGVQIYTHSRMLDHFQKLDEGIAVETLNSNLDILQAEINNLRIIARSFGLFNPEADSFRPIMEDLKLNFLAISDDGVSFMNSTGFYLVDGQFGEIPDTGLFFEDVLKGPFAGPQTSEWGFMIAGVKEQLFILSTNEVRDNGIRVVTGRLLEPVMSYYLDGRSDVTFRFKNAPPDSDLSNSIELVDVQTDRPVFPRVSVQDARFTTREDGMLQSNVLLRVPYLDRGLLVEMLRDPEIKNAGLKEIRVYQSLYLGAFIVLVILLSVWLIRVRSIPLYKLVQAIGDWDGIRLPDLDGLKGRRDEIGLLSETFLHMSGEIAAKTRSLEEQVVRDGLTGLFNRRRFDEAFASEWDRHKRQGMSMAVIMADIDYFKKYNDRYGHPEGDVCLRRVARICSKTLKRPGDVAFRYGGEEFVFILSGTDLNGAERVAEAIREAITEANISHEDNPAVGVLSISLGVASCLPGTGTECIDRGSLLQRADKALYEAKKAGRNTVRVS